MLRLMILAFGLAVQQADTEPDVFIKKPGYWNPHSSSEEVTADGRWFIVRDSTRDYSIKGTRLISMDDPSHQVEFPGVDARGVSPDGRWLVLSGPVVLDLSLATPKEVILDTGKPEHYWGKFSEDSRYLTFGDGDETAVSWLLEGEEPFQQTVTKPSFYFVSPKWRVESVGENGVRFTNRLRQSEVKTTKLSSPAEFVVPCSTNARPMLPGGLPSYFGEQPEKDWLVIAELGRVHLVDLKSDAPVTSMKSFNRPGVVKKARVVPDGSWLVFPQDDSVVLIDTVTGESHELREAGPWEMEHPFEYVNRLHTGFYRSPDGRWLHYAGTQSTGNGMLTLEEFKFKLWDTSSGKLILKMDNLAKFGKKADRWEFAFSADSRWLFGTSTEGPLRLWDLRQPLLLDAPEAAIDVKATQAVVNDNRTLAAACNSSGGILVWRMDGNEKPKAVRLLESGADTDFLAFVPDTDVLTAIVGYEMAFWDLSEGEPRQRSVRRTPKTAKVWRGSVIS